MDIKDKARQIQIEIYKKMSPADKWQEMLKLRRTAWMVKKGGLKLQHPDWPDERVESRVREIFLYATT